MELLTASEAKAEHVRREGGSGVAKDLGALILLALSPALFFWRFFTPDSANVVTFPRGDFTNLHYPYRLFETRELLQGHLPIWNPYVYGGVPSLGDIQYGIFYPLNIIASLLLGPHGFDPVDLTIQIAVHFSLAGIFTYLFAKRILGSRTGAMVSALVFTYSGYLTSFPVQQIIILETSIYLPLILLFLDKGIAGRSLAQFVLAAVAAAVAISVGHPQTFVYVFAGTAAYAAMKAWMVARRRNEVLNVEPPAVLTSVNLPTIFLGLLLFVLLTIGLAAAQLVPSYELLQLTERTAVNYDFVERGFALREMVGLLFPTISGGRFMYTGILPLLLSTVAFLSATDRRQKAFWLMLGCLTLVFSFGSQTFLHPLAYLMVPGFKMFRDHERTVFLFTFAVAILSGYGARVVCDEVYGSLRGWTGGRGRQSGHGAEVVDGDRVPYLEQAGDKPPRYNRERIEEKCPDFDLGKTGEELRRRFAAQVGWLRWLGFLIAAFALAAFLSHGGATGEAKASAGELSDRAFFTLIIFGVSVATVYLGFQQRLGRHLAVALLIGIVAFDLFSSNWRNNIEMANPDALFPVTNTIRRISADKSEAFRISSEGLLPGFGNAGPIYQLEDIVGDSPLVLRSYLTFEKKVDEIRRWQLLNVKYMLTKRKIDDGRLIPVLQEGEINTYELAPQVRLPRAFVVHRASIAASEDEELRLTKAIDPRVEVVLAKSPPLPLPSQSPTDSSATVVARGPDRIVAKTSTTANGVLVLSEVFYPGWKAFVDGQPVEILRANYLFRGVPVEKGSHTVELVYDPSSLRLGITISLISLGIAVVILLAAVIMRVREYRQHGDTERGKLGAGL